MGSLIIFRSEKSPRKAFWLFGLPAGPLWLFKSVFDNVHLTMLDYTMGWLVAHKILLTAQRPNSFFPFLIWRLGTWGLVFGLGLGLGLINNQFKRKPFLVFETKAAEELSCFCKFFSRSYYTFTDLLIIAGQWGPDQELNYCFWSGSKFHKAQRELNKIWKDLLTLIFKFPLRAFSFMKYSISISIDQMV